MTASAAYEPCVFCEKIAARDYADTAEGVVWFEPLNPVTIGHRLFVPMEHAKDAAERPWVSAQVMRVAANYAQARNVDFNLITSGGLTATQSVFHLHIHYLPRREDDGLALPWYSGKRSKHQKADRG